MSRSKVKRPAAHSVAAAPAVAGFRPTGAALAVAAALGMAPVAGLSQPTGGQAIHGQASFLSNGNNLVVRTQNGAGNFSAINWQSFSIPAGSVTRFIQPTRDSTSINRVVGNDPSAIFGTLRSNGKLVLVNQSGIAVGAGAVVDTAGFTASTLGMSDEDATSGRMRFSGGDSAGALTVDGSIVARSGDIVLIAPNIRTGEQALVQSQGATVLAAGHKVEITGRGLEGIHMEVQAGDKAVNLGTLKGDAVGIFAQTLRHSGLVQAQALTEEGGKVVLKATGGDAMVTGTITASAGLQGGSVDVLGERVGLMAGTVVDVSGAQGGGQVRIGGDYQGKNADVPNATATYVDGQATIRADATEQGNGGRVIVWSDDSTRMRGQISARGGELGGDGGFAEVSGKKFLEFSGRADLRAPKGDVGTLLLDPTDIVISGTASTNTATSNTVFSGGGDTSTILDSDLAAQLEFSNVQVTTSSSSAGPNGGSITLAANADVAWGSGNTLGLFADSWIRLNGRITAIEAAPPPPSVFAVGDTNGTLHMEAGTYIQQNATTSVIQVDGVYAKASNGRLSLAGNNLINRFQGAAYGAGNDLTVVNAKTLRLELVTSTYGGGGSYAIDTGSGDSGNATVTTTVGDVQVDNTTLYTMGKLSLQAARDVAIGADTEMGDTDTYVNGYGGISVSAGRDVLIGNNNMFEGGSRTNLYSNGGMDITAAGDIRFRSASTGTGFSAANRIDNYGTGGDGIRLDAGDDIQFGTSTFVRQSNGTIDVLAGGSILGSGIFQTNGQQGGGADAGRIRLTAAGGSLSFLEVRSHGSFSGVWAGDIQLTAQGDINGGSVYAYGTGASGSTGSGDGGMVTATSTGGGIFFGTIDTQGGTSTDSFGEIRPAGFGGDVVLQAKTNVSGGVIDSSGGDAMSFSGTAGPIARRAGDITVITGGRIDLGSARANGGSVSAGSAGGGTAGAGGKILLSAGTGVQAGELSAVGGNSESDTAAGGNAGAGGGIQVSTVSGDAVLGSLNAFGGHSLGFTGAGAGGLGGTVQVSAGGDISGYDVDVSGGSGALGRAAGSIKITGGGSVEFQALVANGGFSDSSSEGGRGGLVEVTADGDVILRSYGGPAASADGGGSYLGRGGDAGVITVKSNGGSIVAEQVPASIDAGAARVGPVPGFSANGGYGWAAGDGGGVTLEAKLDIRTDGVEAIGGLALEPGATGGLGGIASVTFGGTLTAPFIDASGGNGGDALGTVGGGQGGSGGTVMVQRSSGNLVLGSDVHLIARGGNGGNGETEGAPLAGNGGAGGLIKVSSAGADVILQSPEIHSQGGLGGVNFGGSTGATGTQGVFTAEGTKVQVQGAMQLHSIWVNTSDVRMNAGSSVTGGGSFFNFNKVQLAESSALMPSGGVVNGEGARIGAFGGNSHLNLVDNHGVFEVATGATVTAPEFSLNEGQVVVDGTLNIGFGVSSGPSVMTTGFFTNAASGEISGSGNLVVAGGAGTVANFGTISPGGAGAVGTLTLTGNLVMESGSMLAVDFGSATSFDKLAVSGSAQTGGAVAVNVLGGIEIPAGSYSVIQASSLDAGTLPSVSPTGFEPVASGSELHLVVAAAPEPPPPPPPPPPAAPAVQNEVVIFAQLFVKESVEQDEKNDGKDDIVITDTACKP